MLDEILDHLRNYFVTTAERGTYEIKDGMIRRPLILGVVSISVLWALF